MNTRDAEMDALLRHSAKGRGSTVPAVVANRIETVLAGLPDRAAPERGPRLRRAAAVAGIGALLVGGAAIGWGQLNSPASAIKEAQFSPLPTIAGTVSSQTPTAAEGMRVVGQIMPEADGKTGPSVTDQGITVMIREVYYDNYELGVRYTVTSDKPIDGFAVDGELKLNGKSVGIFGRNLPDEASLQRWLQNRYENVGTGRYEAAVVTDLMSAGVLNAYYPDKLYPTDYNVQLQITKIGGTAGHWNFDIDSRSKLADTYSVHTERTSPVGTITLNSVALSPVSMKIDYDFKLGTIGDDDVVGVTVMDDTGRPYGGNGNLSFNEFGSADTSFNYLPLSPQAKSLRIRPYLYDKRRDYPALGTTFRTEMTEPPTEQHPLRLPQGDADALEITGIEYLPDQTIIHTKYDDSSGGYQLLDAQNKPIPLLSWGDGTGGKFAPVSPDQKLVFVSYTTAKWRFIPELEINLDLPLKK